MTSAIALLASPAAADELSDLKTQSELLIQQNQQLQHRIEALETRQQKIEAAAKAAPAAAPVAAADNTVKTGSMPGSFLIPGTDTSVKLGGYVKLDTIYDANTPQGDLTGVGAIPVHAPGAAGDAARRGGEFRVQARQTRIDLQTDTPDSILGPIHSIVEGDFFGSGGGNNLSSNSYNFRLRLAYFEVGNFGFGQYWSNFQDTGASAETLDFQGPTGQIFERQGQIRYTAHLDPHNTIATSIEDPQGDFFGANIGTAGAVSTNTQDPLPDVTAYYEYKNDWGHVRLSGLGRYIEYNNGDPRTGKPAYPGYGVQLSGDFHGFWGKDNFIYSLATGNAIGRYFTDNGGQNDGGSTNLGTPIANLYAEQASGGYLAYQHWWSPAWRSNLVAGLQYNENPKVNGVYVDQALTGNGVFLNTRLETLHANLIWNPLPRTTLGIEYIYVHRDTTSDFYGEDSRLQFSAQYNF